MRTEELDFDLPAELIAQHPAEPRDSSRLLHYVRAAGEIRHRVFGDLPGMLRPGDLLVFNDAKVIPARFTLVKPTGGLVRGLFLEEPHAGEWIALLKGLGPVRPEAVHRVVKHPTAAVHVLEKLGGGQYRLSVDPPGAARILDLAGSMPLPPYIRRGVDDPADRERYQTVYATVPGSVAAPTAGLHFTPELLAELERCGIRRASVTLHVSLGTFRQVEAADLDDHEMHVERYALPVETAEAMNAAKAEGRRVIAIGTTAARVLESQPPGLIEPRTGETDIFIRPPYAWKHVQALLTNFHLPRSTLIALVAAMVGLEEQHRLYQLAIEERYRFFSYGDAMLIE